MRMKFSDVIEHEGKAESPCPQKSASESVCIAIGKEDAEDLLFETSGP